MNKLNAGLNSLRVRNSSARAALVAVGIAALSVFSTNAMADGFLGAPSERVDFHDLDLSKPADAKRLYSRLRLAASQVCAGYAGGATALRNSPRHRCEAASIADAVERIGHPNLAELHAAKRDTKLAQQRVKSTTNS